MITWYFNDQDNYWQCALGHARVTIERRPPYCDRGHWIAKVFGIADIDHQDGFPRYYMDLERAKAEMAEWLDWRQRQSRKGRQ